MTSVICLAAGFVIDLIAGDPVGFPHIVIWMGRLVSFCERILRRVFPATNEGELCAGALMTALVCTISVGCLAIVVRALYTAHLALGIVAESLICWQCLALKGLNTESMNVAFKLKGGDILTARAAVGRIVGRDTDHLDECGIIRATVETVAENLSDGVIAPMFFILLGGAPLGVLYKAINTMDSMVGYRNDRYMYFGRTSARLDDLANFIPSRLSALFMVTATGFVGLDRANSWRIFCRDRYAHKSPNSAQTESACAGALHVQLGGDSFYFGELVHKPTIGDEDRDLKVDDILRTDRLVNVTSLLFLAFGLATKVVFLCI